MLDGIGKVTGFALAIFCSVLLRTENDSFSTVFLVNLVNGSIYLLHLAVTLMIEVNVVGLDGTRRTQIHQQHSCPLRHNSCLRRQVPNIYLSSLTFVKISSIKLLIPNSYLLTNITTTKLLYGVLHYTPYCQFIVFRDFEYREVLVGWN